MNKIVFLFAFVCALAFGNVSGQQTAQKYVVETEYLLYLPEGYDTDTTARWPLVVFLHGAGETGDDIEKIKVHGLPKLVEQGMQFPFIGISPQAKQYGWEPSTVWGLTQQAVEKYRVDEDRVYLTGLSMGGFGTWATAMEYPETYAAIIPICAGGDVTKAFMLSNMPIWTFHGDADDVVPIAYSDKTVAAVSRFNPSIKYTVYPGVGHDSWTQTYENPQVWQWLLSQKKFAYEQVELTPQELQEYAGLYAADEQTEIFVGVNEDRLDLSSGGQPIPFLPAGGDVFFIEPDSFMNVRFLRDESGRVSGGLLYTYWNGLQKLEKVK